MKIISNDANRICTAINSNKGHFREVTVLCLVLLNVRRSRLKMLHFPYRFTRLYRSECSACKKCDTKQKLIAFRLVFFSGEGRVFENNRKALIQLSLIHKNKGRHDFDPIPLPYFLVSQGLIKYDLLAAPHNSHGWCPLASPETVSTTTVPRTNRRTTEIPSPSLAAATPTRTGPHD